jgi:hypothetical protein
MSSGEGHGGRVAVRIVWPNRSTPIERGTTTIHHLTPRSGHLVVATMAATAIANSVTALARISAVAPITIPLYHGTDPVYSPFDPTR